MESKLKAACLMILMFVLGVVSGTAWQIYRLHHRYNRSFFAERRIAKLSKELRLSAWQEQALKDVIQDAHDRAQDLHEALDFDMSMIHEDSVDAIHGLLTPEQQKKFEEMHKHSHSRWHHDEAADAPAPAIATGVTPS